MSSGYAGDSCAAAQENAMVHVENLVRNAKEYFPGRLSETCEDCDAVIPQARLQALRDVGCTTCRDCQALRDSRPKRKIRVLDRVL